MERGKPRLSAVSSSSCSFSVHAHPPHLAAGGSGRNRRLPHGIPLPEQFASAGMFGYGAISGKEEQIKSWMDSTRKEYKKRVFLNTDFEDPQLLERARVMIDLLDEA